MAAGHQEEDFSKDRQTAIDKQMSADSLVQTVDDFAAPVKNFNHNVSEVTGIISGLKDKLQDLEDHGRKGLEQVRVVNCKIQWWVFADFYSLKNAD